MVMPANRLRVNHYDFVIFISLKDHKENFENNPKCRLINPAKSESGKLSKIILFVLLYYCIKTLFKDTSLVNGALISTGGVYNVKNYKRYKEKEDYLQIGVTPDVRLNGVTIYFKYIYSIRVKF